MWPALGSAPQAHRFGGLAVDHDRADGQQDRRPLAQHHNVQRCSVVQMCRFHEKHSTLYRLWEASTRSRPTSAGSGGTGGPCRPATARSGPQLDLDEILTVAVAVADAEGLAAVSTRSVAARFGKTAMALYPYVGSKDQLLALMQDHRERHAGLA